MSTTDQRAPSLPSAANRTVPTYKLYLLRLLYALMAVFLGIDAWTHILNHEGPWNPAAAAAWTIWASYSFLAVLGLLHPLKMLPLVLLEMSYKSIWLLLVAYPLWADGELSGSPATEKMTYAFFWVALPLLATPWRYVYDTYVRGGIIRGI